ncbi:hypothetical protein CBR_g49749 [Chara braunii]|uniref:Uncharacterized protein n=1 Tax=Chara braunii TaxID=69332 RepID=A0A388M5Z0_CHABU|nr:hypothetical protein CBR_g49749 [Chara braunii]|eukprot:GBG89899.1 hypothetical protein CBR_g49749 [Chara braunii]
MRETGRLEGERARTSAEKKAKECKQRKPWCGENEEKQDKNDMCEEGEEGRESPHEERSGHDSCEGRYTDFGEGYERRADVPYNLDPKNFTGEFSLVRPEEDEDEEEEVQEVIEISSGDERDEISRPREEMRPPTNRPREGSFRWEDEFGTTPNHWFEQWISVIKHDWIIKAREFMEAGVAATPLDFYSEMELREIAKRKREILASGVGIKTAAERQDEQGTK